MLVERTGDGRGGPFAVVEGTDPEMAACAAAGFDGNRRS